MEAGKPFLFVINKCDLLTKNLENLKNKGKKNEEGKFVEESDDDSDFDEKDYRVSLKTENYSIVNYQRSMVQKVSFPQCRK